MSESCHKYEWVWRESLNSIAMTVQRSSWHGLPQCRGGWSIARVCVRVCVCVCFCVCVCLPTAPSLHRNESCQVYHRIHVTHIKVMSHREIWMSHVTNWIGERVVGAIKSGHIYERVTSHMWISRVSHLNESCHTYEWVMSHIWMRHVTHMNESCHTYEWVVSYIWMCHFTHVQECGPITHMNKSCHTYEWIMSHIWMSHATHMNESWHTHMQG